MTFVFIMATLGLLLAVFAAGYSTALRQTASYKLRYDNLDYLNTDTPIDAQVRRDLGIE